MKFLGVIAIVAVFDLACGSRVNVIDKNEAISSIAEQVCKGIAGSTNKISTIPRLAEYLGSLPSDHKLAACSKLYLDSITELANMVSVSNDNVCSEEKISAIRRFHRGYVLKGSQRVGRTPKVLKAFFFHYVHLISDICAAETVDLFATMTGLQEEHSVKLDRVLADINEKTGVSMNAKLQYSDIYLAWSLVDMIPARHQSKIDKYLLQGEKRVMVGVKKPETLLKMQELCVTKLEPYYSRSLLSSIRLIDMGFYPSNSSMLDQLNTEQNARSFYELTKICETFKPVQVVPLPEDVDSDVVFLSRDEVENLALEAAQPVPEVKAKPCQHCSISGVDTLKSLTGSEADVVTRSVKNDVTSRKRAVSRLLNLFVKSGKEKIVRKMKKMFGNDAPSKIETLDEEQLNLLETYDDEDIQAKLERSKRSLYGVLEGIAAVFYIILYFIFKFVWTVIKVVSAMPLSLVLSFVFLIALSIKETFG